MSDPANALCPFGELLDRRLLGDFSDEERARLDAHVASGCSSCSPRFAEVSRLEDLIRGALRPLDSELEHKRRPVLDRLKDALEREDALRFSRRRRRVSANTVLFLFVFLGTILIAAEYLLAVAAGKQKIVRAQRDQAVTEIHAIVVGLDRYARERGGLPPDGAPLGAVLGQLRADRSRPYYELDPRHVREGQLLDPWGRPYVYRRLGDGALVSSVGPNGKDDAGERDDIVRRFIFIPEKKR